MTWWLSISFFERGLALTNLLCFIGSYVQHKGLIGSKGLAPAIEVIDKVRGRSASRSNNQSDDQPNDQFDNQSLQSILEDVWGTYRSIIYRWFRFSSICQYSAIGASDETLALLHLIGIVSSIIAFFGCYTGMMIAVSGLLYQSIKSVSGPFLGLQMHANLVETDWLYVLCAPCIRHCPESLILIQWCLLSRIMLGGAIGKWTGGDQSWRDYTAMSYHYWTQPLPNPLSPYFHRLPMAAHKAESFLTYVTEGLGAIMVWMPSKWCRMFSYICFAGILLMINVSGNFGHLGLMTMVEAACLLNDNVWLWAIDSLPLPQLINQSIKHFFYSTGEGILTLSSFNGYEHLFSLLEYISINQSINQIISLFLWSLPLILVVLPYALLGLIPLSDCLNGESPLEWLPLPIQRPINQSIDRITNLSALQAVKTRAHPTYRSIKKSINRLYPYARAFDLGGRYVKFGHMTKRRFEIIIEGSNNQSDWLEYGFKAKPGPISQSTRHIINQRPPVLGTHIWMMDWRLWFLPNEWVRGGQPPRWFNRLLEGLLNGEPTICALMGYIPNFNTSNNESNNQINKPNHIRAILYDYRFTYGSENDEKERRAVRQSINQSTNRSINQSVRRHFNVVDDSDSDSEDAADSQIASASSDHLPLPAIDKSAWWYRMRRVGQYGQTLTRKDID